MPPSWRWRAPKAGLADLAAELDDTPRRLDLLDAGGDPESAVREIFSWSYRHLTPAAARSFRLLGLHPGGDWDPPAVVALMGHDRVGALRCVGELVRAHLIERKRTERYVMHDLLRAYATECVAEETEEARLAATQRLFDHYVHTAAAAMDTLYPAERDLRPRREPTTKPQPVAAPAAALAWLDAELPNLVAIASREVDRGLPNYATALSNILWRYLDSGSHHGEAVTIHNRAWQAATDRGDLAQTGAALGELGQVYGRIGRYPEALDHLHQALAITSTVPDPPREATTRNSLALVYTRLGHYGEALDHLQAALAIHRRAGNRIREGKVLGNLGIVYDQLGRYPEALGHYARALDVARVTGDRIGEADALNNLGLLNCRLGHYRDALRHHRHGLAIARELGARGGEGLVLANLGVVHTKLDHEANALRCFRRALDAHRDSGDRAAEAETQTYLAHLHLRSKRGAQALERYEQALAAANEIGERSVQTAALNGAGQALRALGRIDAALARHESAGTLAREIGDRLQLGRALHGIGDCLHDGGSTHPARQRWQQALAVYAGLGVPDAEQVRIRLRGLTSPGGDSLSGGDP